jgi:hypothetical protein
MQRESLMSDNRKITPTNALEKFKESLKGKLRTPLAKEVDVEIASEIEKVVVEETEALRRSEAGSDKGHQAAVRTSKYSAALTMYLMGESTHGITSQLGLKPSTVKSWRDVDDWEKLKAEVHSRRIDVVQDKVAKQDAKIITKALDMIEPVTDKLYQRAMEALQKDDIAGKDVIKLFLESVKMKGTLTGEFAEQVVHTFGSNEFLKKMANNRERKEIDYKVDTIE